MNDWFRSWHGAPTDPKWLLIAKRANMKPIHVIGTWWALLDYASQHADRGSIAGFDIETFGLFAGLEEEHVSRIVTTLRDKGMIVGDYINAWGRRQPKREDDSAAERKRRQRANNGGNPPKPAGTEPVPLASEADSHAMSRNVTLDKTRGDKSSVSSDTDAEASAQVIQLDDHREVDPAKLLFDLGVEILTASGQSEAQARSLVGKWRQKYGDGQVVEVLLACRSGARSNPVEWVTRALSERAKRQRAHRRIGL